MSDPTGHYAISISSTLGALSTASRLGATVGSSAIRFGSRAIGKAIKATFVGGRNVSALLKREIRNCSRSNGKRCRLPNIVVVGSNYPDSQQHIMDAQSGRGSNAPMRSPSRVTYKKGRSGGQWYSGRGDCKIGSHGGATGKDCDEHPFATTKQGGRSGFDSGIVSLRPVNSDDNRNVGRRLWKGAVGTKGVVSGRTRIMVVPFGPISFYYVNGKYGGR